MGGNMLGIGNNFQFTSEFNFFGDPEAAKSVLDNFPQHVSLNKYLNLTSRLNKFVLTREIYT